MLGAAWLAAAAERPLLTCAIEGEHRTLTLVPWGERLVYRYAGTGGPELTLVGAPAAGTIHYRRQDEGIGDQRFVAVQIRFGNGPYNYIVAYDIHPRAPSPATAYLIVARGTRTLMVRMCTRWTLGAFRHDRS